MTTLCLFVHNNVVTCFTHSPCGIEYFSIVLEKNGFSVNKQTLNKKQFVSTIFFKNIHQFGLEINNAYRRHTCINTVSPP